MSAYSRHPLTAYQRDIWVAESYAPAADPQFNIAIWRRLQGDVDTEVLLAAFKRTLFRNDAFALRFGERDGQPFQWVEVEQPQVEIVDFALAPDPAAACADWRDRDCQEAFSLRHSRMYRAALLRESPTVVYVYLKAHHLVTDGATHELVLSQISADYEQIMRNGKPLDITVPSYLAAVESGARYRASADHDADLEFFRAALADVSPALFTRKTGARSVRMKRNGLYTFTVAPELVAGMRRVGGSQFAFLSAAVATYLARVHGVADIVLGVPFFNRHTEDDWATAGLFVNDLPFRLAVHDAVSMRELAVAARATTRAMRDHDRPGIGDIVRALRRSGTAVRQLYDVTVTYQPYHHVAPLAEISMTDWGAAPLHNQEALSVRAVAVDDSGALTILLDYALDVFDADFPIEACARHLRNLICNGVEHPDEPVSGLSMLTAAEHADLAYERQGFSVERSGTPTLSGLFERQAARTPDRVAIVGGNTGAPVTFGELAARTDKVARALRASGVLPDDRVAVLLRRSTEMIAGLLGVLKSGAAYVPIDPGYPVDRIRFLLADSGAAVALVDRDFRMPQLDGEVRGMFIDEVLAGPAGELELVGTDRNLAYVIYTSGSTGKPKGVMVEHRSVVNRLAWMQRRYPIGADDVVLQKTPISFDVSVWELFWWAIEGASVALLPPGGEKDPLVLLQAIAENRVTVLHFVPSMFGPFLDLLESSPHRRTQASSLRGVFCSGEALPPARVAQFNRVFADRRDGAPRLVNLYGPTEATVDVSYYDCPDHPVDRVPIGRPIDNIRLYVLDPHRQLQPIGVPGELYIGGVGVARGYLNRPELTEERFIEDPFVQGASLFRTGDGARWLADGNLEFLGRLDTQVKIRGNRVELGEVENALTDIPGVRDAVVVSNESPTRGTYLVGYYVAEAGQTPEQSREALAQTLPEYMIPSQLIRIERIPLSPNGKADRRALPAVERSDEAGAAPRNATEATLADIWAEVLEKDRVGIHDDYYLSGGDSILMLRIRSAAEQQGIHFSLNDLTQHPTVAELATRATIGPSAGTGLRPFELVSAVDRAGLEDAVDAYPVSRMQLGLLYYSRVQQTSAMYHDVFQYSLVMPWDDERFRHAFDLLVARHPVLRTSFDLGGFSEPLQIVHRMVRGGLEIVDLRSRGDEDARTAIDEHIEQRRVYPYRFDRAPLYLFQIFVRRSTVELVLSFHHAILDGGSVANLVSELLQDYAHGLGTAVEPVADRVLPSAAEYVRAERRALENAETQEFWRNLLDGARLVQPPAFRPHGLPGPDVVITRQIELADELTDAVRAFARTGRTTLKSLLFAAHCATLGLAAGTTDVTTGLITHGRPELAEAERIAGLFLNTIPLRVDTAATSWLELVRDAFRAEQHTHPHQRYPLSAIQQDLAGTVLDTAFNYVYFRQLAAALELPGIDMIDYRTWEETNLTLLVNAYADPLDGPIRLRIDCRSRVFTPEQADLYTQQLLAVLRRIVTHPDEAPDFAFLAEDLLVRSATVDATVDVAAAIDAWIAAAPRAPAITCGDRQWNYRELGDAADLVAQRLLAAGSQPGDRIGIAMERTPEAIAAIVGVLKSGGATVSLDTSYPPQRIAAMVDRARPFLVIADAAATHLLPEQTVVLRAEEIFTGTAESGVRPLPEIDQDSIAYVLFTSGSTGAPKAVAMPHRSLANLVAWQNRRPSGAVGGITAQYAPLSFDVSFQEIFSTLCGGGTLSLISDEDRRDIPALLRVLDSEGVQRIFLPYVALQQLAETAAALDSWPRSLRILASSGEKLLVTDAIRRLCARLPGVILENQYGPTETHVAASFSMTGDPATFPALPPIGTAIDNAAVHVLDARLRPMPLGAQGEIYLGGSCLAEGYLDQPELTRERFVPHPSLPDGARLYRTGDLGFVLPSGDVVCTGRVDAQVKVRGFRVEPAEIELAITRFADEGHPGITEAAVTVRRRAGNDSFLVAFLVGEPDRADMDQLGKHLRALLPEYMVPTHFEWLPVLPLTPSGKRDDAALDRLTLTTPVSSSAPPRDDYERALVEIAADLLQQPAIGPQDNIFDLGATSLTAMRFVVQVEQRFGLTIPLSEFLVAPTVAALAERLRLGAADAVFDPLVPIRARRPMFFVHPLGGNVLCYVPLAKRLDRDVPFFGLQAAGAIAGTEPLSTVPELAAYYLESVRRVQPHGPYTLGGWSFGGLVAFEMARQLRQAGEQIADLVILDTVVLDPARQADLDIEDPDDTAKDILVRYFFWELLLLQRGSDSKPETLGEFSTQDDTFEYMAELAVREGVLPAGSTKAVIRRLFGIYAANTRAILTYRPEAIDVDVTLLRATEPLPEVLELLHRTGGSMNDDPANGWGDLTTGRLTVLAVPGNHLSIVEEPHVAQVATLINDLIGG
ncbi:non-ribosomal peptide synthetase [Nocardia ninae]|uniref:Non-ribosomal peptide synthetase n=1 Tax=Nocardia ninae NBRC 108245 TaxID=1210091 RepID=A0A511MJ48_9NOCA|nr:non-ribosomal peptide synthetase [Nocardia ninae]GEM39956.1 non-ribosomal peptide synthetase [Nocardia ninae NBRC 108245]